MPITNYYSVNGELIGEKVGTNARVDYLTDALGNVTATLNQSGQVVNTYRYKPYGDLLAKTGAGPDPAFQWVGAQGYRQTGKKYSDVYIRARHYDTLGGRWTTGDRINIVIMRGSYLYSFASPTAYNDPTGLFAGVPDAPILASCCLTDKMCEYMIGSDHCKTGRWAACPGIDEARPNSAKKACYESRSCLQVLNALLAAANSCASFCTNLNGYAPGAEWGARTICCREGTKRHYCGTQCCIGGREFPATPCGRYCLYQHENKHQQQCEGKTIGTPGVEECEGYAVQAQCLLGLAEEFNCGEYPNQKLLKDIREAVERCRNAAGRAGITPPKYSDPKIAVWLR